MKKFLALVLTVIFMTSFTACGSSSKNSNESTKGANSSSTTNEKSDKKLVFGNIARNMKDVWNKSSVDAFKYAADKVGADTIILDSEDSLEKSLTLMDELIAKKVDGISIYPISAEQADQLIKKANDAGIPVTVENQAPATQSLNYISAVGCVYSDIGYAAIKYVAEKLPGSKLLYVAGKKGDGVTEAYREGVDKAMKEFGDKVTLVDVINGDWEMEKSMNITTDFFNSGKKCDVVFANNDQQAQGVYQAAKNAGVNVKILSTGGSPDGLKMIEDGIEYANMTAPVSLQGLMTFRNLYRKVVEGKDNPKKFEPLPVLPVDKSNLDKAVSWTVDDKAVEAIGGIK
jgi:ABC-type sugar transport system substrate-binding protein